jgi:hypothetical protein
MAAVTEYELHCVLACFELDCRFCLSLAEVQVACIAWDRLVRILESAIDQQMMVARIVSELAGWSHRHPADAELDGGRRTDGRAVDRTDNEYSRSRR